VLCSRIQVQWRAGGGGPIMARQSRQVSFAPQISIRGPIHPLSSPLLGAFYLRRSWCRHDPSLEDFSCSRTKQLYHHPIRLPRRCRVLSSSPPSLRYDCDPLAGRLAQLDFLHRLPTPTHPVVPCRVCARFPPSTAHLLCGDDRAPHRGDLSRSHARDASRRLILLCPTTAISSSADRR
jgi:hypothetical protein